MELELKHCINYLSSDVCFMSNGHKYVLTLDNLARRERTNTLKYIKLILHPLSDLTKPILEDGKIPIVELAKIADFINIKIEAYLSNFICTCSTDIFKNVTFMFKNGSFVAGRVSVEEDLWLEDLNVKNQLELFQKLAEWHIDFQGLIDSGLAIDINTLKL